MRDALPQPRRAGTSFSTTRCPRDGRA